MGAVELQAHDLFNLVVDRVEGVAVTFHPDGVDAAVGATAAGDQLELLERLIILEVQYLGLPTLLREAQAFRNAVDGDDALRAEKPRAGHRKLANGTGAPHCNG